MKILVVEDDAVQLRGLTQHLAAAGHTVITAATSEETEVCLASVHRYDAAVVDVCIPGGNGAIVIRVLREIPGYAHLPIVVITGLPPDQLKSLAILPNLVILQKPFEYTAVDEAIDVAIGTVARG